MAAKEAIMICFDNSNWMTCLNRYSYRLQLACTRLYCRAKLESNPKNAIGFITMGTNDDANVLEPTSDLDKILRHLKVKFIKGGDMDFTGALGHSITAVKRVDLSDQKRVLFFTGGPPNLDMDEARGFGGGLKEFGIGVDVVNFCIEEAYVYEKKALNRLVRASRNNNNSSIRHIRPDSSTLVRDILCRHPELISPSSLEKAMEKERHEEESSAATCT